MAALWSSYHLRIWLCPISFTSNLTVHIFVPQLLPVTVILLFMSVLSKWILPHIELVCGNHMNSLPLIFHKFSVCRACTKRSPGSLEAGFRILLKHTALLLEQRYMTMHLAHELCATLVFRCLCQSIWAVGDHTSISELCELFTMLEKLYQDHSSTYNGPYIFFPLKHQTSKVPCSGLWRLWRKVRRMNHWQLQLPLLGSGISWWTAAVAFTIQWNAIDKETDRKVSP